MCRNGRCASRFYQASVPYISYSELNGINFMISRTCDELWNTIELDSFERNRIEEWFNQS